MKNITDNVKHYTDMTVLDEAEKKFSVIIRKEIREFLKVNSGGYVLNQYPVFNNESYEIRVILSVDKNDESCYIKEPLDYFLGKTNGKIVPIAKNSGGNYYCINNETGKVYYWSPDEDLYYGIAETLEEFVDVCSE